MNLSIFFALFAKPVNDLHVYTNFKHCHFFVCSFLYELQVFYVSERIVALSNRSYVFPYFSNKQCHASIKFQAIYTVFESSSI